MTLDAGILGRRVAEARARAGLTQQQLASTVNLDRSAIAKVESGDRRVSALELAGIANAVGARIEWFVNEPVPSIVSHRNTVDPGAASPRIDFEVERRVQAVEFLASLDPEFRLPSVPERPLPLNRAQAERLAGEARTLCGASAGGPLPNLAHSLESIGLLAFAVDMGTDSADAATVLLPSGAVSVINGTMRLGRRRLALAHEVAHVLVADDFTVDWRIQDSTSIDRRESIFDVFARALLLPEISLRTDWERWSQMDGGMRSAAVRLASAYRVDFSTLARRLLDLELIDSNAASRIRTLTTTRTDIVEMGLLIPRELELEDLPMTYVQSVLRLYRSESVSTERALDLLMDTFDESDLPDLPTRSEQEVWQYVS